MKKHVPTTAPELPPEQENDLNLRREAFCQYYTKNQALFGNATLSYAEASNIRLSRIYRLRKRINEVVDRGIGDDRRVRHRRCPLLRITRVVVSM